MRTIQRTISIDRIDPRPLVFRAGENDVRVHFKTEHAFDAVSIDGVLDADGVPESGGFYIDIPSIMTNADGRYMMVISYDGTTMICPFRVSVERSI